MDGDLGYCGEEGGGVGVGLPRCHSGYHAAGAEGLDEEDEGHYGEDVVVGGEGGKPVYGEVSDPDDQDGEIDW